MAGPRGLVKANYGDASTTYYLPEEPRKERVTTSVKPVLESIVKYDLEKSRDANGTTEIKAKTLRKLIEEVQKEDKAEFENFDDKLHTFFTAVIAATYIVLAALVGAGAIKVEVFAWIACLVAPVCIWVINDLLKEYVKVLEYDLDRRSGDLDTVLNSRSMENELEELYEKLECFDILQFIEDLKALKKEREET